MHPTTSFHLQPNILLTTHIYGNIWHVITKKISHASSRNTINAVVSINGPHVQNKYANIKENGELLVEAPTDDSHLYFINGVMASDKVIQYLVIEPNSEIPWDRIPKSTAFRLVIHLLNGGHIMEPPYFPHHDLVYARYQVVYKLFAFFVLFILIFLFY
uniref:Plastocyanin-like domain-containing protein n=1 Tax=Heterorhabditis bacteriophora TaxID=37862 RepID=A0A1I7WL09_HETBA